MNPLMIVPHDRRLFCRMPASEGLCRWAWPQSAAHQSQPTMSRCIMPHTLHPEWRNVQLLYACSEFERLQMCSTRACVQRHLVRACRTQRCLLPSLTLTWSPPARRRCCHSRRRPPAQVFDALMSCGPLRACALICCWRLCCCMRQRLLCL
jgi:hypothetical protein